MKSNWIDLWPKLAWNPMVITTTSRLLLTCALSLPVLLGSLPAQQAKPAAEGAAANPVLEDTTSTNLPNIAWNATKPRFPIKDKDWPAKPGEASICLWNDDKVAAYSLGVDDNLANDIPWWREASSKRGGLPITYFIIATHVDNSAKPNGGTWETFQKMLEEGFRIESHTMTHLADVGANWKGLDWEYAESQKQIHEHIPNTKANFLAYPGGPNQGLNDRNVAAKYYLAARGAEGVPNVANQIDYMNTTGFHPAMNGKWNDPTNLLDGAATGPYKKYYRGWAMMFWHGIDKSNKSSGGEDNANAVLDYLAAHKDDLWAGHFGDVATFAQERDTATMKVDSADDKKIVFTLTDRVDDAKFDFPLTIKVRLPDAWTSVAAKQKDSELPAQLIEHEGGKFALVKAVPDRGQVILTAK